MTERRSGALVVGFRKDDPRRFIVTIDRSWMPLPGGGRVPVPAQTWELPAEQQRNIVAGRCVSCNASVYLNRLGYSAVLEKDADVCCMECEDRFSAEITRSL